MTGYGPHEPEVLGVFKEAARLPPERLPELIAVASTEGPAAAMTGRRQLGRLRADPTLGPWLSQAETTARQWASELRFDHLLPMGGYEMGSGVDPRTRGLALRSLFEAAAALIARDHLSEDEFEALVGPWEFVIHARPSGDEPPRG